MDTKQFEARKIEHIRHSLDRAHQASGLSGLDSIQLVHDALPDLDFEEVSIHATCLGSRLKTPFYVSGMTAGHEQAFEINRTLALACQKRGWAMGVGSQRRELEASDQAGVDQWKKLREEAPDLVLFANLGVSQLISARFSQVEKVVRGIGAQALVIHLNALQEVIQPEGTPQFKTGIEVIRRYCEEFSVPIVLKETGCGFSRTTLKKVSQLGIRAVDVSGLGGTHWGRIEGARAAAQSIHAQAAQTFANWGESTVSSVQNAEEILPESVEIWASGGVRSGLDAAKLLALGADCVGYAKPALEAAFNGVSALSSWMEQQEYELKVALFCTDSRDLAALKTPGLGGPKFQRA